MDEIKQRQTRKGCRYVEPEGGTGGRNMTDYISREAAVTIADYAADEHPYEKNSKQLETYSEYNQGWNDACDYIRDRLEREKPADVEPVRHGRWEHKKNDYSVAWCSKCKGLFDTTWHGKTAKEYFAQFVEAYRYCPRCGAKMDFGGSDA